MVKIQPADGADLDAVRTLLREYAAYLNASVGEEHICLASYEKELASLPAPYRPPGGVILLATVQDQPAGVIALKPLSPRRATSAEERACEMKRLWVRPQFHGLRLGRLLSERLIEEARARGYTAIYLDTMPATMQAANHIYAELGFVRVERYGDNSVLRAQPGSHDNLSPDVVFFRREI
ncbi:MAG: GNAT family N-acetyltransferase [Acidobacteriota bacterium]|nr:GNAT family N-acetyltransferase [Acidobacteriota bacterium]